MPASAQTHPAGAARSPRPEPFLPDWLVANRNFVLLWAAYGVSALGDHLSEMALFQSSGGFARDDSMRVQALMTFCFFLPFVILGPLAGWWADRFSRKWTMIAADLIRCAIMGSLTMTLPWLLGLRLGDFAIALPLALAGIFAAFFSPARQAMVPTLIRDDQLVRANAMISALGTIAAILSAWLGGKLVDLANAGVIHLGWNYRLDALSFILSAALLAGIAMSRSRAVPHATTAGVLTPLREGFAYVRQHRRVFQMILVGTVFWAAAGVIISVIPAIVRDIFGGTYTEAGAYRGLVAAGLAGGAAILTLVGPSLPTSLAMLLALLGGGFWIWALDVALVFKLGRAFSGLCLFMIGVHGAGILVNVMVIIQRFVPDDRRGRVFGVSDMCTMAAITASTGFLGLPHIPHLDHHIPWLLAVTGAGLLATTIWAWFTYRHGDPSSAGRWMRWRFIRFCAAFWYRARRIGPCTVPRSGPVVVVANDVGSIGPLLIHGTCTHRWLAHATNAAHVENLLRHPSDAALCTSVADEPSAAAPSSAVAQAALRSGATVIPCCILRADSTSRRAGVRVRYGRPLDLASLHGREDQKSVQSASERILQAIAALRAELDRDGA